MNRKLHSPFNQQPLGGPAPGRGFDDDPSDGDAPPLPERERGSRLDPFSDLNYDDDIVIDRPVKAREPNPLQLPPGSDIVKAPSTTIAPAPHVEDEDDFDDAADWTDVGPSVSERLGVSGGALLGVCEPALELLCQLNRVRRLGHKPGAWDPVGVLSQFEAALAQASTAARGAKLEEAFTSVVGPLRCTIDVVMMRAGFEWAAPWKPLAAKWAQPDRVLMAAAAYALQDGRQAVVPVLEVLNVCIALTADLLRPVRGQPDSAKLIEQMGRRLKRASGQPLCPSAYEGVFTRAILPPVGRRLKTLAALSVALLLLAVTAAVTLNVFYASRLHHSIDVFRAAMAQKH